MPALRTAATLGALLLTLLPLNASATERIQVFAAASLTDAMNSAIARYEQSHDVEVVPVYASSSTLARQIANGAPADLYLSANEQWMDWLADQGATVDQRIDLLANRLVLIAPRDSEIAPFTPGDGTAIATRLGPDERLSVGNTDHVPAGIYAKQALESLGEWPALQSRLASGDNVRAAMALVERGEAPLGIVYQTDAKASDGVRQIGVFPDASHTPITYPMAVVTPSPSAATEALRQWLAGDAARQIFSQYGFTPLTGD